MFHFRFIARPKSSHPKSGEYAGAAINCWIVRDTQQEAESYARGSIADEGWHITGTEAAGVITRETQLPKGLEYFEQAEIDGEVFVFFTHPAEAQDDGL